MGHATSRGVVRVRCGACWVACGVACIVLWDGRRSRSGETRRSAGSRAANQRRNRAGASDLCGGRFGGRCTAASIAGIDYDGHAWWAERFHAKNRATHSGFTGAGGGVRRAERGAWGIGGIFYPSERGGRGDGARDSYRRRFANFGRRRIRDWYGRYIASQNHERRAGLSEKFLGKTRAKSITRRDCGDGREGIYRARSVGR